VAQPGRGSGHHPECRGYGKHRGLINEVLQVVLQGVVVREPSEEQRNAITHFKETTNGIAVAKASHVAPTMDTLSNTFRVSTI
jgi:hypothetical protein